MAAAAPIQPLPPITEKSILRYRNSAPINFRLILVNSLLIGGCAYVLYASISRYQTSLDDFDHVARTNALETRPCGLAVPRTKFLLESLNQIDDGAFAEFKEEPYVNRIENAMCGTTHLTNALRAGLQEKEILEHDTADGGAAARASVKEFLCACEGTSCNAKHYGDILRRITHAYVLSAPAFERYRSGVVDGGNCLRTNNPFASGVCAQSATIETELAEASANTMTILAGSATEPFPTIEKQLYRLLALSVIEYRDRERNGGTCFKNIDNSASPLALCQSKLSTYVGAQGSPIADPTAARQTYYADRVSTADACDWSAAAGDSLDSNPSMPNERARKFGTDYYEASTTPVMAVCLSMHEFGWFDRKRLFGLPDPVSEAEFYPEHSGSGFARWLAGWFYYGLYDTNKHKAETFDKHTAYLDLKLFVGYKFASTVAWVLAACLASGYLLVFALVPFTKLLYIRLIRKQLTDTRTDTIVSKPLTTGGYVALGVTMLVGLWVIFVDGGPNVPYPATAQCDDYAIAGGPYVTTDERSPDGLLGLVLIILASFVLLYMGFCRRVPKRQRVMPLNLVSLWPMFALILLILLAGFILLIVAGDEWWNRESTDVDGSDQKTTSDFEEVVAAVLWGLIIMAAATGMWSQRHMAANTMLNVPRGKLPVFAYGFVGIGVALAIVAAVLLWPLFDCQVELERNELVCGNDVEVRLKWGRFWGCVAWFSSVVAIFFVIFSGYKVLFTTPRRGDAASIVYNRSKDQEIRALADQNNRERFARQERRAQARLDRRQARLQAKRDTQSQINRERFRQPDANGNPFGAMAGPQLQQLQLQQHQPPSHAMPSSKPVTTGGWMDFLWYYGSDSDDDSDVDDADVVVDGAQIGRAHV